MKHISRVGVAVLSAVAMSLGPITTANAQSSLSSSSGGTSPIQPGTPWAPLPSNPPAPTVDPDEATESLRSAYEFYQVQYFDNYIDPQVQPIADHCVALGLNGEIPLNKTVDLSSFGYDNLCLVQVHRLSRAESVAEDLRISALEYRYNYNSHPVAIGSGYKEDKIYISIAYG